MNKKLFAVLLIVASLFASIFAFSPMVFADTSTSTTDITNVVLEWMPLIIIFAMLGMLLGMLKKFGKW